MLHDKRVWCVGEVESAEDLARKLTESAWCCCTAFQVQGFPQYYWINDSTSEDAAQEYAVLIQRNGQYIQLESITFSWCTQTQALQYITKTLNGDDDANPFFGPVSPTIQTAKEHGRCPLCA